jgi:hypothetical protein
MSHFRFSLPKIAEACHRLYVMHDGYVTKAASVKDTALRLSEPPVPHRLSSGSLLALVLTWAAVGAACVSVQQPERRIYVISREAPGTGGSGTDLCTELQIKCFDRCWNRPPPLTSIKPGSGKHHEYCTKECREEFMECMEDQERLEEAGKKRLDFSTIDNALAWLREHKTEVAVGTVVVVAGVVFVVATGGSGALILAPLAL